MKISSWNGAMYVTVEENDVVRKIPVELGDGILHPGEFVSKLGEKKRTSFYMQPGFYLRYEGMIESYLIFNVNLYDNKENIFYAFAYVDKNTLLISSGRGMWDVRVNHLEKFQLNEIKHLMPRIIEQLELELL
jgi:hypothetical protein